MTAQRKHEIKWSVIFAGVGALAGWAGTMVTWILLLGGTMQTVKDDHIQIPILTDSVRSYHIEIAQVQQDVLKFSLHPKN